MIKAILYRNEYIHLNFLISAAAMSSVDSSLLSGATYLTHNVCGEMFGQFNNESQTNADV